MRLRSIVPSLLAALAVAAGLGADARADDAAGAPMDAAAAERLLVEAASRLVRFEAHYAIERDGAPAGAVVVRFESPGSLRWEATPASSVTASATVTATATTTATFRGGASEFSAGDGRRAILDARSGLERYVRAMRIAESLVAPTATSDPKPAPLPEPGFTLSLGLSKGAPQVDSAASYLVSGRRASRSFGMPARAGDASFWSTRASDDEVTFRRPGHEVRVSRRTGVLLGARLLEGDRLRASATLVRYAEPAEAFSPALFTLGELPVDERLGRQLRAAFERAILQRGMAFLAGSAIEEIPLDAPKEVLVPAVERLALGYDLLLSATVIEDLYLEVDRTLRAAGSKVERARLVETVRTGAAQNIRDRAEWLGGGDEVVRETAAAIVAARRAAGADLAEPIERRARNILAVFARTRDLAAEVFVDEVVPRILERLDAKPRRMD